MLLLKPSFTGKAAVIAGFILSFSVLLSGCEKSNNAPSALNQTINYAKGDDSGVASMGKGWSQPEPTGTWTEGKVASLNFNIPGDHNLVLDMQYYPFVTPKHPALKAEVWVNGKKQADWNLVQETAANPHQILLGSAPDGHYVVTFKFLNPVSPNSQDSTPDTRVLGIFLKSINITAAEKK